MPKDIKERFKEKFALQVQVDNEPDYVKGILLKTVWRVEVLDEMADFIVAEFQKDIEEHFVSKEELREFIEKVSYISDDLAGGKALSEADLLDFITKS